MGLETLMFTEEENYFDGLMGGQQEYDMNTYEINRCFVFYK